MISVKKVGAVAAAIGVALGLGACSAKPGVALEVNGRTYTESQVDRALVEYNALIEGTDRDFNKTDFVWVLAGADATLAYGEQVGVTITDEQALQALSQQTGEEFLALGGDYSPTFLHVIKWNLVASALRQTGVDQEAYQQLRDSLQVDVNPRYGSGAFDRTTGHYARPSFGDARTVEELLAGSGQTDGAGETDGQSDAE